MSKNIIPVMLCGGSGSRLWPMSRQSYPKQYLKCYPNSRYSFLQETQRRIQGINGLLKPILVCNSEHRFIAAQQMQEIGVNPNSIILEPIGRNTGPAITIACLKAIEIDKDPILLILPADHSIGQLDTFRKVISEGFDYALKGNIVTFGVKPTSPETGYGYIESEKEVEHNKFKASPIKRFLEKPDLKTAEQLIKDRKFLWNSGIFMMNAKTALHEINEIHSEMLSLCKKSMQQSILDLDFQRIEKKYFAECKNISFDKAIMEKTKLGVVLSLEAIWDDLGDWNSLWNISEKDENGNSISGKVVLNKVENSYFKSESRLIAGVDVSNLVVIETSDSVLVTRRESSQKIKEIVDIMKSFNYKEATQHKKIFRPWGSYFSLAEGPNWQVKRINVNPGESLSLQKHNHRTEHWVVVSGEALVEVGKEKKKLFKNQSIYIPLGFKHRLSNPGKNTLILIEVQSGNYLGEDDIIRYEDKYGRKN